MKHHLLAPNSAGPYRVAILSKSTAFNKQELLTNYANPLKALGLSLDNMIAFTLKYNSVGKAPVKHIKEYLEFLLPALTSPEVQAEYLYVTDAAYFKTLVGTTKADPNLGYILPCAIKGYTHLKVVLGVNYQQLIYNPDLQAKLDRSMFALASGVLGTYEAPGTGVIHSAQYPESHQAIQEALNSLHQYAELSADIEAFSLRFNEAGVGTIGFAWDKHNGLAFACDYIPIRCEDDIRAAPQGSEGGYGYQCANHPIRAILKDFLCTYKGKLTWHNASYDLKILIYTLWMKSLDDTEGLLEGLEVVTRLFDDTKLIAYLATNSTAGNVLGLKPLAQEFAGSWAKDDIKDIRKIPLDELLQYNVVDCLSTNYVKEKYYPIMVADDQLPIYNDMLIPSVKTLLQTELTGMPMNKARIGQVKGKLTGMLNEYMEVIIGSNLIQTMNLLVQTKAMESANAKLKVKQHPIEKFMDEVFNPNSGPQLQRLLYELMGLPVLDRTDTKQPATGAETIEKLIHHTEEPLYKELLTALIGYGKVAKILSTFIPAFEKAIQKSADGIVWLHGSFNLGGAVSGRLSSSEPNLQNIPAKSIFAKLIKECFEAPKGWLMCGADFNSLEDMISALTTKDTNKLKVYTDGFDGHSLRAAYYFKDELEASGIFINMMDPKSVNQLKKMDHPLRQESKAPTFLLTYGGTYHGMMSNLGWTEEKSKGIEANYHVLYAESDAYIQARLKQASIDGYVNVAFGLRVRTPLLSQVAWGSSGMPYEASAEGRTAGNAMGQSYCLLNNRAANDFMQKVWKSKYRLDILPIAEIHDAGYYLIRDNLEVVEWANREMILSMQWQELPEIQHPTVKLGAALDIFWPNWANPITLPNNADQATIIKVCNDAKYEYLNPKLKEAA